MSRVQSERVHGLACQILDTIGIEVRYAGALEKLEARGFRTRGSRVFFSPLQVNQAVEGMRRLISRRKTHRSSDGAHLKLSVSSYSLYVHDIDLDRVVPCTTEQLVRMTKLIDTLTDDGVSGTPPGIPTEIHPDLQPIAQYRISANYARQGAAPVDPTSPATVRFLLDMADVMGNPITSLPVYVVTPLRLGGTSLDVVLACAQRLEEITVSSMPAASATAPIHPFGALALAAAETIGGAIVVHVLAAKPVTFAVNIYPFDLRAGAMVFGSPENLLFQMLCRDFNRFYGWEWDPAPNNTYGMAAMPNLQSCGERAAIMALGAFLGARHFGAVGTLSQDDVFSPQQLLADVETRDWVERALGGMPLGEEAVQDWIAEIRSGVERGFVGMDSTLDNYLRYTWYPERFERGAIGAWRDKGEPRLSARLQDEVRRRIASYDYELDADRHHSIERIYRAAQDAIS